MPAGCGGDYLNLNINLDLDTESLLNIFRFLLPAGGSPLTGTTQSETDLAGGTDQLTGLVQMLSGGAPAPAAMPAPDATTAPGAAPSSLAPAPAPTCLLPGLLCRTTVTTSTGPSDLSALLLDWEATA